MGYAREMWPDMVLHVRIASPSHRWPHNPDAFTGMGLNEIAVDLRDDRLDEDAMRAFVDSVDVIFTAETMYDWRLCNIAREADVATIVHGNPEFYRHDRELREAPGPDSWWWPTNWLIGQLPSGPIVPIPVDDDWPHLAGDPNDEVLHVVHVAGHRAAGDRNGTEPFMAALRLIGSKVRVTVVGQDGSLPPAGRLPKNVELVTNLEGVDDRRQLYAEAHLVVLPRRYGGNCLPAYEAMASGCALAMSNCAPNHAWPVALIAGRMGRPQRTPFGSIPAFSCSPHSIASVIDNLARDRGHLACLMGESTEWAQAHRWSVLGPVYDAQTRLYIRR